jgi:hypothetical protein
MARLARGSSLGTCLVTAVGVIYVDGMRDRLGNEKAAA